MSRDQNCAPRRIPKLVDSERILLPILLSPFNTAKKTLPLSPAMPRRFRGYSTFRGEGIEGEGSQWRAQRCRGVGEWPLLPLTPGPSPRDFDHRLFFRDAPGRGEVRARAYFLWQSCSLSFFHVSFSSISKLCVRCLSPIFVKTSRPLTVAGPKWFGPVNVSLSPSQPADDSTE
jgi:hypothetical protein